MHDIYIYICMYDIYIYIYEIYITYKYKSYIQYQIMYHVYIYIILCGKVIQPMLGILRVCIQIPITVVMSI